MVNKSDYFVICETATLDKDGRVSLINIFDTVKVSKFPFKPAKFVVAFSAFIDADKVREASEVKISFKHREDGTEAYSAISPLESYAKDDYKVLKITSDLDASGEIEFSKPGFYEYKLFVNGEEVLCNELRIQLVEG